MMEKEAIWNFEKARSLWEQVDIGRDIENISSILSHWPIDMQQVRAQIDKINMKYPENEIIFKLIFLPQGETVPLYAATDHNLIQDLDWKRTYLQAIRVGKIFDEFCKEMRSITTGE